jgi:pimeloyl-ACP methyl ester carboxylesterase
MERWSGRLAALAVAAGSLLAACSSDREPASVAAGEDAVAPAPAVTADPTLSSPDTSSAATTSPSSTAAATTPPATTAAPSPVDDPFFDPAGTAPGAPGEIIRARSFDTGDARLQGWQVLAWSRDVRDEPVAVSGVVVAPSVPATGPRPILSWAHGTTGMGDQCAPSRAWGAGRASERALLPALLDVGWVFAATDYQGLGTPGEHTYVVGQAEGRNVLDIARAAQRLATTGATAESPVVAWGHSQGGGAALFAAELAPTYAPELDVVGAIGGAPAAEFGPIRSTIDSGPYAGFQLMASIGFTTAYPELRSAAPLSPEAEQALDAVRTSCVAEILDRFAGRSVADVDTGTVDDPDALAEILERNTAGNVATDVPIFIYHGEDDDLIPVAVSTRARDRYCALGVPVQLRTYPGTNHVTVIGAALGEIVAYAQARVAGEPAPTSCS